MRTRPRQFAEVMQNDMHYVPAGPDGTIGLYDPNTIEVQFRKLDSDSRCLGIALRRNGRQIQKLSHYPGDHCP